MQDSPVLITGSTGKTGRRIAARLEHEKIPVRHGSRQSEPRFDWEDRASWPAALDGVRAAWIAFAPDLAVPGAVEAIEEFTACAVSLGVERLVLLSGRGEVEAQRAERVVQHSSAAWTILRASWFAQNFSESFLHDAVKSGRVALPVGDVGEPFVDADDIADVAVAALTETGHESQLYELTGPRLLTFDEAVAVIAHAAGRAIQLQRVTTAEYARILDDAGLPPALRSLILYLFTTVLDGRNARLADGVQRALGRPPREFRDYARDVAATGAWADVAGLRSGRQRAG